jgi:hypothetical protein
MSDELHIGDLGPHDPAPRRTPLGMAIVVGAAIIFVLVAVLLLPSGILLNPWFHGDRSSGAKRHVTAAGTQLLFGPVEQAYASRIHIENIAMSRAENFLNQEVTTISGEVVNTGAQSLRGLELTVEFSDSLHQVILRESRSVIDPPALASGARRAFEISFEHVPTSWSMEQPTVAVTALRLASGQ